MPSFNQTNATREDASDLITRAITCNGWSMADYDLDGILERARDMAGSWDMDQIEDLAFWEIIKNGAL